MIYKELDPFDSDDKFARSGRAAEEQMAFYFRRFFGNDPDILVLNGIRLEVDGDAAQIDHLIIHSHGLSVVESKSVHGKIQIKDDGQWIRWFNGNQSKGIASPIIQARLQERFFRGVLGRASRNEALFAALPIDLYVAISDDGVIVWPKSGPVPGVCKADQVPDKIIESNRVRASTPGALQLNGTNRERIAAFLATAHKPLVRKGNPTEEKPAAAPPEPPPPPVVTPPVEKAAGPACKHCGSSDLEIRYGFSYFFFCLGCGKNAPIKPACPKCNEPAKLRKQKKEFFIDCEKCRESSLYFINP